MKYLYSLTLILFSFLSVNAQQWTEVAALPASADRHHPVTFGLNGMGYSLMGVDSNDFPRAESYKYDPDTDTWTQIEDFPGLPRGFSYGVTDGEFAYLGFGLNGVNNTVLDDLWKFDPNTETWTELSSCPCTPRFHPAMILVDGKIFIGAGGSIFGNLKDWWEYDIETDTWSQKQDIPGPERHHPFYFGLDGAAYVGFGHGDNNPGLTIFKDFYRWNLETESWTILDDFPGEARVAGTQFSHDGYGYILSGDGNNHDFMEEGEFWQFDPADESWTQRPSHEGFSRWAPGSFTIGGDVYFTQGQERFSGFPFSSLASDLWKFDLDLLNSPLSVEELNADSELHLFPNPAADRIQFSLKNNELITSVKVINTLGETVLSSSDGSNSLDLSALAPGSYILQSESASGIVHSRFIKD